MDAKPFLARHRIGIIVAAFAVVRLVAGAYALREYGYFRDELYYLACARHFAFGYVDHPPLSIAVLRVVSALGGESLVALRAVPLLASVALLVLTSRLVTRLGGGAVAVTLASLALTGAPVLLSFQHHYSMNALDPLFWVLAALLLVWSVDSRRTIAWACLGVVLGLGLENKLSVLWLGAGIAVAHALFDRASLRTRGPYVAAAIAVALFAPYLVWEIGHGFPTLEFMRHALELKYRAHSIPGFLAELVLIMNPASLPIWAAGLVLPFASRPPRNVERMLACVALTALAIVATSRSGKAEYLAAMIPIPLALGGCAIERWAVSRARVASVAAMGVAIVAVAVALAPLALPVLTVQRFVAYETALGLKPRSSENKELGALPQGYADMFGWRELVDVVADATARLSPAERARAVIWTRSGGYGSASAIEILGRDRQLPPVICGHNNYWLWGPARYDGSIAIIVGGRRERLAQAFDSVEQVGTVECGLCMPYENHKPVYIARGMHEPVATAWAEEKWYE